MSFVMALNSQINQLGNSGDSLESGVAGSANDSTGVEAEDPPDMRDAFFKASDIQQNIKLVFNALVSKTRAKMDPLAMKNFIEGLPLVKFFTEGAGNNTVVKSIRKRRKQNRDAQLKRFSVIPV